MRTYWENLGTIEQDGHTFEVHSTHDDLGPPWQAHHDGHGKVREMRTRHGRHVTKSPGESILHTEGYTTWLYDLADAMKTAKRDGWGLGPEDLSELTRKLGREPNSGDIRTYAVRRDFEYLRGWIRNDWSWICLKVTLGEDIAYLGGVESFGDHWRQCANEMANEIIAKINDRDAELALHIAGL
jgi:hypothetical protein